MDRLGELGALIARHAGEGVTRAPLAGVSLMASGATTAPIGSVAEPALAVVVSGTKRTVLGDTVFEYGAGEDLIVSGDLPLTPPIIPAPFVAFRPVLPPPAVPPPAP